MLKKMLFITGFAFLFVLFGLTVHAETSYAATYYVSVSGSDSNNGTSTSTPWKTLSKVSGVTFNAGDQILLKSGDTWSGQNLTLHGSGTSTNPIVLTSYGTGNKPHISPNILDSYAIMGNAIEGWKITNLELSNAREGIDLVYNNSGGSPRPTPWNYIDIENMYMHDIDGNYDSMVYSKLNPTQLAQNLWYDNQATGIAIRTDVNAVGGVTTNNVTLLPDVLTNLTISNNSFYNTDVAVGLGYTINGGFIPSGHDYGIVNDVDVENNSAQSDAMFGFTFEFIRNATIKNITVDDTGSAEVNNGSASLLLGFSQNVTFDSCTVSNQHRYPGDFDGTGFDFEGGNFTATLENSTFTGIDAYGMMITYNSVGGGTILTSTDLHILNNVFADYSRSYTSPVGAIQFYYNSAANPSGTISGNTFITDNDALPIYSGAYSSIYPYFTFTNNIRVMKTSMASGKTATASSYSAPSSPPLNAVDGNISTSWVANGGTFPQWLEIDLGSSQAIGYIKNLFTATTRTNYKYKLEGSNNNTTWTVLADKTAYGVLGPWITEKVGGTYRYIRMTVTGSGSGDWASSAEFSVWAAGNSGNNRIDDAESNLSFLGGHWSSGFNQANYYNNNSAHWTNAYADYVQYTFTGTAITWIGSKNTDHGLATIYIDGVYQAVVDTYSGSHPVQQILYQNASLTNATHTIKIYATNSKNSLSTNYYQDVDAFDVWVP